MVESFTAQSFTERNVLSMLTMKLGSKVSQQVLPSILED